jgi:hypothetical protein
MMNNVKCRDLIISLTHYEEYCIKKFSEFTKKVPPTPRCYSRGFRRPRVIDRFTSIVISTQPSRYTSLVEKPTTEEDLYEIIDY